MAGISWNDSSAILRPVAKPIHDIRVIRHSLTHASGRVTAKLGKAKIDIEDVDGVIQILPFRIRAAYQRLGPCVLRIIDKAAELRFGRCVGTLARLYLAGQYS
jgi:hypothetical protein